MLLSAVKVTPPPIQLQGAATICRTLPPVGGITAVVVHHSMSLECFVTQSEYSLYIVLAIKRAEWL